MIVEMILGSSALQAMIVGASGVLAGSALGARIARRTISGESGPDGPVRPQRPAESGARVPDAPGPPLAPDRPSPGRDPETGRTIRRPDGASLLGASDSAARSRPDAPLVPDVRPQAGPPSVHMSDKTQVRELVGWMLHWEYTGTFSHAETLKFYRAWAREARVVTIPDAALLTLLAAHPAVKRRRDRIKDPVTGRVRKLPSGTPERETTYTFARVAVAAPGGVAASDVGRMRRAA